TKPLECGIEMMRKYGDTQLIPGKTPIVFTGDPACIQKIYAADPDTFVPLNQDMAPLIGARSVLLASGAEHKRARRLMMPAFHGERMRSYGTLIVELTRAA